MQTTECLNSFWGIEKYPDGWDIIVKDEPMKIIIGSMRCDRKIIKHIVKIHNEALFKEKG